MPEPRRVARPLVIVTRALPDPVEARLRALFDTRLNADDHPFTRDELAAAMAEADVLVPAVTDTIDAALIAGAGPRLRLLANFGAGVNHLDLRAARARGIAVTNTPGVLTDDTADLTMALILSVPRRLAEGEKLVRSGAWTGWSPGGMLGHRIGGKALGIVGMGRIGQAVARRARAFGLSIHYHNRHRLPKVVEADLQAAWHPHLDEMLAAVEAGRLAGAGLDVWRHEPAIDPRLLALPNVVMTPHMGSATLEGRVASGEKVIANIRAWADGHRPPDQVLEGWA
jgi:glyoxylate reductase